MSQSLIQIISQNADKEYGRALANNLSLSSSAQKANSSTDMVIINKKLLKSRDPYTLMMFAYALDPIEFTRKFEEVGFVVKGEESIPALVELLITGGDKAGAVRHIITNRPTSFSVNDTFARININSAQLKKNLSKIKYI